MNKITPEEVLEHYKKSENLSSTAVYFNRSVTFVTDRLNGFRIKKTTTVSNEEIIDLYKELWGMWKVGRKLGISYNHIDRALWWFRKDWKKKERKKSLNNPEDAPYISKWDKRTRDLLEKRDKRFKTISNKSKRDEWQREIDFENEKRERRIKNYWLKYA